MPEQEARRFACNSVVVDRHVVINADCPVTTAELRARGFEVHEVDVSEFLKAGGGPKCLVLILERAILREHRREVGIGVRREVAA